MSGDSGNSSGCSICTDVFDDGEKKRVRQEHCCKQDICLECMHRHILSVLREGMTGDGRRELKCALGCGAELCDEQIRTVLHESNYHILHDTLGRILYILWIIRHTLLYFLGVNATSSDDVDFSTRRYAQKIYFTQTLEERTELALYEKWSLTVALSKMHSRTDNTNISRDADYHYVHVLRCPRPDCECLWLVNKTYRDLKLGQEARYKKSDGKRHNMTQSLLQSASAWLFFSPTSAEKEEGIMNDSGKYTTEHWLSATDIHPFRHTQSSPANKTAAAAAADGRKVICPNCHFSFCGLCVRPWNTLRKNKRSSHDNFPCAVYAQRSNSAENDDFLITADSCGAKCCPGCSMRTNRTEGCNHMTCLCGYQWCYICECRWNPTHYSCRSTTTNTTDNTNNVCIIS